MKAAFTLLSIVLFAAATDAGRFAVLVGNADGGSEVSALRYVKNDILSVKNALKRYCAFSDDHIVTVEGKGPQEFRLALTTLKNRLSPDEENLLFLYYTGHADREALKMGAERFSVADMKQLFSEFPASIRIGIFDACQSGSFTRLKGGKLAESFLFRENGCIKGEVILSSSSPTENAQESDLLHNSVFTFHLVNALGGSGDLSGDGRVSLSEAYQYCYNHTVASTVRTEGGVQHPGYQFRIQGEGDVILADLTTVQTGILLEGDIAGSVIMLDASEQIRADLVKDAGSRVMIALVPGQYQVVVGKKSGEKWRSVIKVTDNRQHPLSMADLVRMESEVSAAKGGGRGIRIGTGLYGGYAFYSFAPGAAALETAYGGFSAFGFSPRFTRACSGMQSGGRLEVMTNSGVLWFMEFSRWSFANNAEYTGIEGGIEGDGGYPFTLSIRDACSINGIDLGVGYGIHTGLLRNFQFMAGVRFSDITYRVTTDVFDAMYDFNGTNDWNAAGDIALPFAGVGYRYIPLHWIMLTGNVRCRYQPHTENIGTSGNTDMTLGLPLNLSGVDCSLSVMIAVSTRGAYR